MKHLTSFLLTLVLVLTPLGVLFTPQIAAAAPEGYSGHPTIYITKVVRDTSVTFKAYNLPRHDEFRVRMGRMGTRGVGGVIVGSAIVNIVEKNLGNPDNMARDLKGYVAQMKKVL